MAWTGLDMRLRFRVSRRQVEDPPHVALRPVPEKTERREDLRDSDARRDEPAPVDRLLLRTDACA
ncbi:hypothetical protein GCM10007890_62130 [Methylobacterium tardum]|uniref:Uncharacterized protein n=1 Tax=Methylobacterium tardum TaxID=374432 RepID=A0AA37TN27_9HYPH|nr:hypothetical protein GCM10007890_62130 [Methylobacterium tardum]